jgi:CBS domain-containing protein
MLIRSVAPTGAALPKRSREKARLWIETRPRCSGPHPSGRVTLVCVIAEGEKAVALESPAWQDKRSHLPSLPKRGGLASFPVEYTAVSSAGGHVMQVRDVLKAKGGTVYSIDAESTVADAVARMVQHNIGSLPIVDDDRHVIGIFTERDVLRGTHRDCHAFPTTRMRDVMTLNPVSCNLDDDLHHVMGKMSEYRVGQLPVLLNEQLVGLISIGDVVKNLYEKVEAENQHLLAYIHGAV